MVADTIRVLAFGSAAEALGWNERGWTLPAEATLGALIADLEGECPPLRAARQRVRFAVNRQFAAEDTPLHPGDEVAIIPPVTGGEEDPSHARARLVREPIDPATLLQEIVRTTDGAACSFLGVVRAERNGDGAYLEALEYSAYDAMALEQMQRIADEALERHGIEGVRLVHRLGRLAIGETSIAVVVSAPHRAEAFEACREIIEAVKEFVPIFKQEHWGTGDPTWVDGI